MTILDHFGINVSSYARSKAFYEKALAPLGIEAFVLDPDGRNLEAVIHTPG
jgi:catechol 2,3-dioxygenase-like lactoylglutathione lyase family enzyme